MKKNLYICNKKEEKSSIYGKISQYILRRRNHWLRKPLGTIHSETSLYIVLSYYKDDVCFGKARIW